MPIVSSEPRFSISTWSLHRSLGITYFDSPENPNASRAETWGAGSLTLLEVPARVAELGIHTLEICHFHLQSQDPAYLGEMRSALQEANVELLSVLVDTGDITHPTRHQENLDWTAGWVDAAAVLGAKRARVIAGQAEPTPEALELSRKGMRSLADRGKAQGVRVTTENWYPLLSKPQYLSALLDSLEGDVGLNFDFGNWGGETKYQDLAAIAPLAESCHAKCAFLADGTPDAEDYRRCLDILKEAHFRGPYTLIYDSANENEWEGVKQERELVRPYLTGGA